jgi:hypothetical protein
MIDDFIAFRSIAADSCTTPKGLSRRSLLQAGAAAGGGLVPGENISFGQGEAQRANAVARVKEVPGFDVRLPNRVVGREP